MTTLRQKQSFDLIIYFNPFCSCSRKITNNNYKFIFILYLSKKIHFNTASWLYLLSPKVFDYSVSQIYIYNFRGLIMTSIAIIGAGLSGLTAASILKNYADVTVFEKSRGVSGRMSTRRSEPYYFDHGVQFFTARTSEFKDFIAPLIEDEIIKHWDARYVEFEDKKIVDRQQWDQENQHYVGVPGMNHIAKYLSQRLTVNLGLRVHSMRRDHEKWCLEDDFGKSIGKFDWVISTIPAQQASDLLPSSLPFYSKISEVKMKGCFALMLGFENALPLEFDAASINGEDVGWISVNSSKPSRNDAYCLLVHSTNKWADEHIDDNRDHVAKHLCNQASELIGHDLSSASHKSIHGWRFAHIEKQAGETHLIDPTQNIAVCGDWLIQGRVESAFTSGFETANNILKHLV